MSGAVDGIIVSFLGASTFAILSFGQSIYLVPVSLFGMSIAAAELPQMSSVIGSADEIGRELRLRLLDGLRQISFFVIPTAVALIAIGDLLVAALYQTGRFGDAETLLVWYVVATLALGLPAVTSARLCSSTFYALRDTRTPLVCAMIRVALTATAGFLLAIPLRPWFVGLLVDRIGLPVPGLADARVALGVVGVVTGNAAASWLELVLLRSRLAGRIGQASLDAGLLLRLWSAAIAAALVAGFAGRPIVNALGARLAEHPAWNRVTGGVVVAAIFGAIYLGLTVLLGVREARGLVRRLPFGRSILGTMR